MVAPWLAWFCWLLLWPSGLLLAVVCGRAVGFGLVACGGYCLVAMFRYSMDLCHCTWLWLCSLWFAVRFMDTCGDVCGDMCVDFCMDTCADTCVWKRAWTRVWTRVWSCGHMYGHIVRTHDCAHCGIHVWTHFVHISGPQVGAMGAHKHGASRPNGSPSTRHLWGTTSSTHNSWNSNRDGSAQVAYMMPCWCPPTTRTPRSVARLRRGPVCCSALH